jgi:hypothetical protein
MATVAPGRQPFEPAQVPGASAWEQSEKRAGMAVNSPRSTASAFRRTARPGRGSSRSARWRWAAGLLTLLHPLKGRSRHRSLGGPVAADCPAHLDLVERSARSIARAPRVGKMMLAGRAQHNKGLLALAPIHNGG